MTASIRSMTGFGQGTTETDALRVTVDLRSVNGRFADLKFRLPAELTGWEREVRRKVLSRVRRGRVELFVKLEDLREAESRPQLNAPLLEASIEAGRKLREEFGVPGELEIGTLLGMPGMFQTTSEDRTLDEAGRDAVGAALEAALQALDADRLREGATLGQELAGRLKTMVRLCDELQEQARRVPQIVRGRLEARLQALASDIGLDPGRVAQETALLADRCDVTEELVRLAGHLEQLGRLLEQSDDEPLGKRLDFLVQEIHREVNTIGSKSADLALTRGALELKSETEKVREQVQNIE